MGARDQEAVAEDKVGHWMGGSAISSKAFGDERAVPAILEF